jgi:hypothetical protein
VCGDGKAIIPKRFQEDDYVCVGFLHGGSLPKRFEKSSLAIEYVATIRARRAFSYVTANLPLTVRTFTLWIRVSDCLGSRSALRLGLNPFTVGLQVLRPFHYWNECVFTFVSHDLR